MLPLKLSIEGLYSYQNKQTIDFSALTEAGLFGIFGAVGSGKSSVLEAIGFVLYGETERLNKSDKRSYNMLNLKSNQAAIDFEFLNYEDRKFKFVANWKRKKRFEETTPIERISYEWIGEEWIPLTLVDATGIIGLSYDNFRRTIIIPQGKFKEFLDLKGKDRSDMMKEIFHLHQYDLSAKVAVMQTTNKSSLDELKGALSGFENISNEAIALKEEVLKEAALLLKANKEGLHTLEGEFSALNTLKTNFEELEKRKLKCTELNVKKPKMDALQAEIAEYEKVDKVFGSHLITLSQSATALTSAKDEFSKIETNHKTVQDAIVNNEKALQILQPQFDDLDTSKNKVLDLVSIAKVLKSKKEYDSLSIKIDVENKFLTALSEKEQEEKNKLETFQKEVSALKSKRTDTAILLAVGQWFIQNKAYQKSLDDTIASIKNTSDEIIKIKDSFKTLGVSITNWPTDLEAKSSILETTKKELETAKNKLLVAKELAQFSHNLHDGESCPLCGALEHPNPMQVVDVTNEINAIELSISEVEKQEKIILETKTLAQKNQMSLSHSEEQLLSLQNTIEQIEKEQKSHLQTFIWETFDPTDFGAFETQQQAQNNLEISIKKAESNEKICREAIDKVANDLKKYTANLSEIKSEIALIEGAILNERSQLRVLSFQEYENKNIVTVQSEKIILEVANTRIASEYKLKSDEIEAAKKNIAELNGRLMIQKKVVDSNAKLHEDTQKLINDLLTKHQFDTIESVQAILSKSLDILKETETIKEFTIDLQTAIKLVDESEKLVAGQQFDEVIYATKEKETKIAKEAVDTQLGVVAALQKELAIMKNEMENKADLLIKYAALESRAANLSTLANMFSGSGFVNYVSSIYLQNLADVANVRFHRMTKNQLSLQINSANEFEVIDYLNNGASRSVKTLSGGQGFQASLCLALALAESVQSLNKNNKNFFFIDEGFGTQDPESVAVVFETLQSLYKENRIVGIISHVTELQERIPRSINVVKDEERGSAIHENWN